MRLITDSPGLVHPLKVDADVSVIDGVPVYVALRPEKVMLCEEVPEDGCNFAVGEVVNIAYLGDLSIYHVRLTQRTDDYRAVAKRPPLPQRHANLGR